MPTAGTMDPIIQAELIKEAARIDPITGRMPEDKDNPACDHCGRTWTVLVTFTDMDDIRERTRRLCRKCTTHILEWI
jgi:hypothetical protein